MRTYSRTVLKSSTPTLLNKLEDRRQTLRACIRGYQSRLVKTIGDQVSSYATLNVVQDDLAEEEDIIADALNDYPEHVDQSDDSDGEPDWEDEELLDEELQSQFADDEDILSARPESIAIWMPSRYPASTPSALCRQEQLLRDSQAQEALQGIHYGIGHKSVLIKFLVRRNRGSGQYKKTRAWAEVNSSHADLVKHWAAYRRAQDALVKLPNTKDTLKTLEPIQKEQLQELKDITEENRTGQRNDTLPWFWRMGSESGGPKWSTESMLMTLYLFLILTEFITSYAGELAKSQSQKRPLG